MQHPLVLVAATVVVLVRVLAPVLSSSMKKQMHVTVKSLILQIHLSSSFQALAARSLFRLPCRQVVCKPLPPQLKSKRPIRFARLSEFSI